MGEIIRYVHRNCKFEYEFLEGVGFHLFRLEGQARKKMRSGEWGDRWKELMEQYPEGTATLNKALCFCEKCKKYFTEPRIEFYIPKEGYHFEYDEKQSDSVPRYIIKEHYQIIEKEDITCPDCKTNSTVVEKIQKIKCPVCGKELRGKIWGNWD